MAAYKPLFPYFGGKSKVASVVWARLGNVRTYIEPFFGSGAVFFGRPAEHMNGSIRYEVLNDANGEIVNFWRAVKADPEALVKEAKFPCSSLELWSRHDWMRERRKTLFDKLLADPSYFDLKAAAFSWYGWSSCIGATWGREKTRSRCKTLNKSGIHRPAAADDVMWFSERLLNAQVLCGDWKGAFPKAVMTGYRAPTGVFFDPPYSYDTGRDSTLYGDHESGCIAHEVREWCKKNGHNENLRIVLAGYEGEHNELEKMGWEVFAWQTQGGYGNLKEENQNRELERLWFSPHTVKELSLV